MKRCRILSDAWRRVASLRGYFCWVMVLLVALAMPAAGAAQGAGTVVGEVVDAQTGQPVVGAKVTVSGSRAAALTDAQGRFTLRAVAGDQVLIVERLGYSAGERSLRLGADAATTVRIELIAQPVGVERVVVSATRNETRLADAPGSVSVVTREEMENRNLRRLDNAMNMVPGVFNERPTPVDDTHGTIVIRGIPGQRRTLIMMDGVPVNDAYNGNVRFNGLPVEQVERIEVVRGPASSLYGGQAMGGAINVVTRLPEQRRLHVNTGFGSALGSDLGLRDQRKLFVSAEERAFGRLGLMASVEYQETGGYAWNQIVKSVSTGSGVLPASGAVNTTDRTGDPRYVIGHTGNRSVTDQNVVLRAAYDISPASKLRLSFFNARHRYEHEGAVSYLRDDTGNPVFAGNVVIVDGTPKRIIVRESDFAQGTGGKDQFFYSASLQTQVAGGTLNWSAGYNDLRPRYTSLNLAATRIDGPGKTVSGPSVSRVSELQLSRPLWGRNLLTLGASMKSDRASLEEHALTNWTDLDTRGDMIYEARGGASTYAVFAQNELVLLENVTAHFGLRYDRWTTDGGMSNDVGKPGYPAEYGTRTSSFVSPRAALLYRPLPETAIRGSVGRAFRGPTVFELYRTWTLSTGRVNRANPELDPENSTSWDLGVQQEAWTGARFGATYFHNDIREMINRKVIDPMLAEFHNTGRAVTRGVELEAEQELGGWGRVFANYTRTDALVRESETSPASVGKRITFIPKDQWNAGGELSRGAVTTALYARHVGRRFSTDDNSDHVSGVHGSRDAATVLDLKSTFSPLPRAAVSVSIDNLLNREYYDFNRAPGRSFFVELSTTF
jgi:iron complex outermembrane recepter protein